MKLGILQKIRYELLLFRNKWQIKRSKLFDENYYLVNYPDVKSSGIPAIRHYLLYGSFEGRKPSSEFDGRFYLRQYPDVKSSKINPLIHYILYGKKEGRKILEIQNEKSYTKWIEQYDTYSRSDLLLIKESIARLNFRPLISVLMPVYDPNSGWLKEAINSVINQIYSNWELCIADDCSTNPEIKSILQVYQNMDQRIKVVYRTENGHISATSNSALKLVTGEYTALLDHDDILPATALYLVAETINKFPDSKLIYSDEDKIDSLGNRTEPYFKCDWNPELFYGQNYISHLGVYSSNILKKIGGFRVGFEGSQDYDLALRFIEQIKSEDIIHIPRVLYHWRLHEKSTSFDINSKTYAYSSAVNAINDHFKRINSLSKVDILKNGLYRLSYPLPDHNPLISIIIPTWNKLELIKKCVDSILHKTHYANYEILIIDNKSDEKEVLTYFARISTNSKVEWLNYNQVFNFSSLVNYGVNKARGEYICLMNNDIEVISELWIEEMLSIACQEAVGAVGSKLLFPDKTIQHAGVILGFGGIANHAFKHQSHKTPGYFGRALLTQEMSAVTAACVMVKKSTYDEIGGFNEIDLAIAFNDIDFCIRLKMAGYRNVWTPFAEFYHYESASRGEEDSEEKKARFNKEVDYMNDKWETLLKNDPAYNPNLALYGEDFSLAWPPRC